jgi:CxxC motif-containing protein (DUF1111 family)
MNKFFSLCILVLLLLLSACSKNGYEAPIVPVFDKAELQPGGSMTSARGSDRSYILTGVGLKAQQKLDFWTGFSLFRDPWVIAPSSTEDRDGLGPVFNTRSCISCHSAGGRGPKPEIGLSKPSALVIRLGFKDGLQHSAFTQSKTYQAYGDQIQPRGIPITHARLPETVKGEAHLSLTYQNIIGQYADGSPYILRKPEYALTSLNYGPIESTVGLSPRFAPIVYGTGLLDAIAERDLLKQEDPDDRDVNGISARYNRVAYVKQAETSGNDYTHIGRFGHKAKHPNLAQQVAAAFRDDIGITNTWFTDESCAPSQGACEIASSLGGHNGVEIPDKLLNLVIAFNQFLAVPPARNLTRGKETEGRALFYHGGCADCHTPKYITADDYPVSALAGQTIWPYTDLALHDMGPGLADGVTEFAASGREWKTPPLWGLGAQKVFRKEALYLHDGRARSLAEAILWHGGEAQKSQQFFINLSKKERSNLLAFLDAI